jgi:molybdate transport system substrate-binding protein
MDRRKWLEHAIAATGSGWGAALHAQGGMAALVAATTTAQRALDAIVPAWSRDTGYRWSLSYGAPGSLVRQIQQGLPADLFLSGDESFADRLSDAGLTVDRGEIYATGGLALVWTSGVALVPDEQLLGLKAAWPSITSLAMPHPELEPFGGAARALLEQLGLWAQAQSKLVWAESAIQAAQLVASGTAQLALTALSLLSPAAQARGTRSFAVPSSLQPPLRQRMVLMKSAGPAARALYRHLQTDEARSVMSRFGLTLP